MATAFQPFIDQENITHSSLRNTAAKSGQGRAFGPIKSLKARSSTSQTPRRALGDVGNTTASLTSKKQDVSSLKSQLKPSGKTPGAKLLGLTPKPKSMVNQQISSTVKSKRLAFQILQDAPSVSTTSATSSKKECEDSNVERENMFPYREKESEYEYEVPLYLKTLLKKHIKFEPPYTEPVFFRQRQCSDTSQETLKLDLTLQELPPPVLDCFSCEDNIITLEPIDESICDFSELGPVDISLDGLDLP